MQAAENWVEVPQQITKPKKVQIVEKETDNKPKSKFDKQLKKETAKDTVKDTVKDSKTVKPSEKTGTMPLPFGDRPVPDEIPHRLIEEQDEFEIDK